MPGVDPPWDKPQETQYCRECERLVRELALARELLQLIVDEAFAAQMCDKAKDVTPELGAAIYKMLPDIKKFPSTSRVPGLVAVEVEDLEWAYYLLSPEERRLSAKAKRIYDALTRAKEGE